MGTSYSYGHSISTEIMARIQPSFTIGILGVIATVIVGIPLGIISATKQYSIQDYSLTALAMFFAAMPGFWIALMMMLIFALKLGWLPATGLNTWKSCIMPVLCNALTSIAIVMRMTRSSMLEVIRQDYIRTARVKGLKENTIIHRHALKNALIPVVTVVGMQMSMVMSGSVIIETVFSIPGLGNYLMAAINARDYPVINGCVLVLSLCICVMHLVVDIVYTRSGIC